MHGALQPEVLKAPGFAVNEGADAEPVHESTQLTKCRATLLKVHEVDDHPPLREEPQRLPGVRMLTCAEDLDLPLLLRTGGGQAIRSEMVAVVFSETGDPVSGSALKAIM